MIHLVAALLAVGAVSVQGASVQASLQIVRFDRGVTAGAGTVEGANVIGTWLTVEPQPPLGGGGNDIAAAAPHHDAAADVPLRWQLATEPTFSPATAVAGGATVAAAASLHHASVPLAGLRPGQRYFFRFQLAGPAAAGSQAESPVGSFTLPAPADGNDDGSRRHLADGDFTMQLLHINDQHNRIEAMQTSGAACSAANEAAGICIGGFGRIATFVQQARATGMPTLVLDAGDQSTGTLWDVLYRNHSATAAMQNYIGFDAMTLGNHEFDNGPELLAEYLGALRFPVLGGCNVDASGVPALEARLQKWAVREVAPGVKVGVLGYVTTDTAALSSAGAVRFSDVVTAMQRCVAELQAAEPDVRIIVALGHAGYLVDMDVAARVPGIDLVIGGHSHTFLYGPTGQEPGPPLVASNPASGEPSMGPYPTFVTGPSGRRVPVVQAAFYSKYVGALNLTFSAAGELLSLSGQPVLMGGAASSSPVPRDAGMLALVEQLAGPVRALQGSVVGSLAANLTADRAVVRAAEAPLGNLVCDAMLWYIRNTTDLQPQLCITNGGGLRAPLSGAAVATGDVLTLLPFGNTLAVKNLSGGAILTALENGVAADWARGELRGAFAQVAGLRFTFDPAAPKNQRVLSVEVATPGPDGGAPTFEPLEPCMFYTVVTNNYMADGGDSYTSFRAGATLYGNGPAMDLSVVQFISAFSPVPGYTAPEGRITRCSAPPAAPAAACSAPRDFGSCPLQLQLLHFNDVHNRIEAATSSGAACNAAAEASGACFGGMARLATAIKGLRAGGQPTLVLDAGDESVGTLWDVIYPDRRPTAAAQNALAIDAFTLGNHEFDFGVASLVSYIRRLNAPVLACNLNATAQPDLATRVRPYTVLEVGGTGVRVGVVGWITPDTAFTSKGGAEVAFLPVVPAVAAAVAALRSEYGTDIRVIIGLSHAGLASDLQVAEQVSGIDLIVGGHDHYFLFGNGTTPGPLLVASDPRSGQMPYREYPVLVSKPGAQSVPIVQAYYASRYLGAISLGFDADGVLTFFSAQLQLLGGNASSRPVARDEAMLALIGQFAAPLGTLSSDVLGFTPVALSGDRSITRVREAPLGNLLCDAMLWYLANSTQLPPQLCITNGGGLRADIAAGNITTAGVFAVLPFGNVLTVLNVTGAQLLAALEVGASGELTLLNNLAGRFAQVSGLEYAYDDTAPVGSRIVSAAIRTRAGPVPVDPCATYSLATNDFMAAGGDTYTVLTRAGVLFAAGPPLADVLMDYIAAFSPLQPGVDGRVTRCSSPGAACPATRQVQPTCASPWPPSPVPPVPPPPEPQAAPSPEPAPVPTRSPKPRRQRAPPPKRRAPPPKRH